MILRYFPLLSFILLLACASPMKKYNKQDYIGAARSSLKNLQKGKAVNQSENILEKSMIHIVAQASREIEAMRNSGKISKWGKALKESEKLQEKIVAVEPYLGDRFTADLERLISDDVATMEKLYHHYYYQGIEQLDRSIGTNLKIHARNAYSSFSTASRYGNNTTRLDSLMDICIEYGRLLYNVDAGATFEISQEWEIDRMFEDVEQESDYLLAVYYKANVPGIDCELEVDFSSLDFRIEEDRETLDFEKEVQDGFRTETDTSGNSVRVPVYVMVQAEVEINRRIRRGEWQAGVRIRAYSPNCELDDQYFGSQRESEAVEYNIFGDERAVPDKYRRGGKGRLVSENDMAEEMLEDIYRDFIDYYF